jgi:hypothetical protein
MTLTSIGRYPVSLRMRTGAVFGELASPKSTGKANNQNRVLLFAGRTGSDTARTRRSYDLVRSFKTAVAVFPLIKT